MRYLLLVILSIVSVAAAIAQNADNGYVAAPLVFDRYRSPADSAVNAVSGNGLKVDCSWIDHAQRLRGRQQATRYRFMVEHPELVKYNFNELPEAPSDVTIYANPSQHKLSIDPSKENPDPPAPPIDRREVKLHNWLHSFNSSLHFTQAYISKNWYQGGENNLNVLGEVKWECNYNTTLHPNWLFNNMLHYKLGINTAHNDSLRNYAFNEDLLEFSSQLGYKAVKHWYYSANLYFKTQLFNNYKSNTNDMVASWLSPGELTVGLGMTYNYKDADGIKTVMVSIAPLSYNMKICRDITNMDPTVFGIKAGRHTRHDFGSNIEGRFQWKITPNIEWISRLYVFTNYHYVQGDLENTFSFEINRYLSTKIFTHLRYDKSHSWDNDWHYWQFKEILSFGLSYRFSTN